MSDDGTAAIVVIALIGNPFSPDYHRERARGDASALGYSSMNVALYAKGASAWALQEQQILETDRTASSLAIGTSSMRWEGEKLVVEIDERTSPIPRRLRGRVVIHPEVQPAVELAIDADGEHRWWPVAPVARIEADFAEPRIAFRGHGYHDANAGSRPIDAAFERWSWSRARFEDSALLTYDVVPASGEERALALRIRKDGVVEDLERTWRTPLATTGWRLPRRIRVDEGSQARVVRSLEDGPFYARALVETRLGGQQVVAVHEELAAHRLRTPLVRLLTRARMRTLRP